MIDRALVVPCFNEASRIDRARFGAMAQDPTLAMLFVDDGSTDGTADVLESIVAGSHGQVLRLAANGGKGEAVRAGLRHLLSAGQSLVGYADADLATPPDELLRLFDLLATSHDLDVIIGSRVLMVGRTIDRTWTRHMLGRVFATMAANILRVGVYDTQCGAKFFRRTPALDAALSEPFLSRWAFDVELLGRLLTGPDASSATPLARVREVPLECWIDVGGSKVSAWAMMRTLVDLGRIELALRSRRR